MKEEAIIKRIKSIEWKKGMTRRLTVRLAEHWMLTTLNFKKYFGVDFPDQLMLMQDEIINDYFNKPQFDECVKTLLNKIYESSFSEFYVKQALEQFIFFLEFTKKIKETNLKDLKKEEIIKIHDDFVEKEDKFTAILWIIFLIDDYFSQELERKLKEYLESIGKKDQYDEFLNIILSPEKKSAIFLQTLDILKLADKIKNNKIEKHVIQNEFQSLVKKYSYFSILNFDEEPLGEDYFRNEINKILGNRNINPKTEIERINDQFKQNAEQYKKIIKILENEIELAKLADACHNIAYYRDHRNDIRREGYLYARELYIEIAKRLNMNLANLLFMTRDEIRESLKKEAPIVNDSTLENRKKFSALALIDKKLHFIFDHKTISDLLQLIEPRITVDEFRGVAASPGKVTGKVKIIFNVGKEAQKLKQGNILVTSMTNLDFVPLMSKAAAIVTDEGGLLCHAAIVCREMKKPCIVGTNIATKVLKDDDVIEVHANHGLIKIIKKK